MSKFPDLNKCNPSNVFMKYQTSNVLECLQSIPRGLRKNKDTFIITITTEKIGKAMNKKST